LPGRLDLSLMLYLWATLLILLNVAWLATVLFGLPGTWMIVVTTGLFAWWQRGNPATGEPAMFSIGTLIALLALAAAGELAEFIAGAVGSKHAGGTRRGSIGALVGGIIGGIIATFLLPLPLIGTLIGTCIGAAAGALVLELSGGTRLGPSVRSGMGAGVGTLVGRLCKVGVGIVMWVIVAVAAYWP
jgi:uncharacterized protein YqgC (DUF456 family)